MEEKQILFFNKVHHPKLWGNECWVVSAHVKGDCTITKGKYSEKTLSWLWQNQRELFGNLGGNVFPLLTKVIDAKDKLSVQVHPDDEYARVNANGELGKTECWYIMDCEPDAELIVGHNANSREEMSNLIVGGKWEELLRKVKIKPGDFFYIPAGTIHGIGKGTVILETQQPSDVTYRLYDYDRMENGKLRDLHIKESIAVSKVPHEEYRGANAIESFNNARRELLIEEKYFSVYKIEVNGQQLFQHDKNFLIVSVLKGNGAIDNMKIEAGEHFIIPHCYKEFLLQGELELIVSNI